MASGGITTSCKKLSIRYNGCIGGVAERSIALALKTGEGEPSVGSNPTASAKSVKNWGASPE